MIVGARGVKTSQEISKNQLTWAHRVSRGLKQQQGACMGLAQSLCIYIVYLCLLMGLLTVATGTVSDSFTGFCDPTPYTGLPCPTLINGEVLSLPAT